MPIDVFVKSPEFQIFIDEALCKNACDAVEKYLDDNRGQKIVKRSQLKSIHSIIHSFGYNGIKQLIENQKQKNTNKINRQFWNYMHDIILEPSGIEFSLRTLVQTKLEQEGLLEDMNRLSEKSKLNKAKKENKAKIQKTMEIVLPFYFEHFNCHYFYSTCQGA